jgi:site-specific recombinase XerD
MVQGQINSQPLYTLGSGDIRALVDEFLVIRATDRECSAKTIADYRQKLGLFVRFLSESGNSLDITQIGQAQIRSFKLYLQRPVRWDGVGRSGRPLSDASRASYDRALRAFFHWVVAEAEYLESDPLTKIPKPKIKRTPMRFLSKAELEAIWKSFPARTRQGERDKLIFLLLVDTGIRASELCGIVLEDVNLATATITIRGKGGHTRVVGMSQTTLNQLITYVRRYRQKCAVGELLLIANKRQPVGYWGLQRILERWAKQAQISVPFSAHSFRRTYATRAIQEGADGMLVAAQMGHVTLAMTKKYVQEAGLDLGKLQAEHSPLRGLKL